MAKDLLRLLTCGSVDDGKSTLIGRLLHDSKDIYDDHLRTLERDSRRVGSAGHAIDFALLLDGLKAEREQGITIDVAYRYFATPRRKFIIADCPGHVQYTRNMVTGGSTANLAIVLVDAEKGVLEQTKRHSFLVSLLDIGHLVVAVNKMDRVGYAEDAFEAIRAEFSDFAARLEVRHVHFIPISALFGDNVVEPSPHMPWHRGTPLLGYLETVHVASDRNLIDLRFPVQYAHRRDAGFRGYAGSVASGVLRKGAEITVLPSRQRTRVTSIVTLDGELDEAFPPLAVTVTVADDIDISRGDLIVAPRNVPRMAREFEAILVWMSEEPLARDRPYILKHTTSEVRAEVSRVRYKFDVHTLGRQAAESLELNDIGRVHVRLSRPLGFDPYVRNRATGCFILIDPIGNATVAGGMIIDRDTDDEGEDALSPGADALHESVARPASQVTPAARSARLGHQPATVWLTGLPRSGKTTLAYALEQRLFDAGCAVHVLDGVNLRRTLSEDLGFAALERSENVRRAAHVARLCNDAGLITIVAVIAPYRADRAEARAVIGAGRFVEAHLAAPLAACEARDDAGLYARARRGEIARFTGVSAPYEAPTDPDIVLATHAQSVDASADAVLALLRERGLIPGPVPAG